MTTDLLEKLRSVRQTADRLNQTALSDLTMFFDKDKSTFARLPGGPTDSVSVATGCSNLMCVCQMDILSELQGDTALRKQASEIASAAFAKIVGAEWDSSGLRPDNAFTTSLIIRTAGMLKSRQLLSDTDLLRLTHNYDGHQTNETRSPVPLACQEISKSLLETGFPDSIMVSGYDPTPTVAYWLLDGATRLNVPLTAEVIDALVGWTTSSLREQVSLIEAHDQALMDPVHMGMAACLALRLSRTRPTNNEQPKQLLPSPPEIQHAIELLFSHQTQSGIWPKYFPLFHYAQAGSNYTFTFELLEALLAEVDGDLLSRSPAIVDGLSRCLNWCETNRLAYYADGKLYKGWNSGGELRTMRHRMPESWATAVVHMFLHRLRTRITQALHSIVLKAYRAELAAPPARGKAWRDLVDIEVRLNDEPTTVQKVLHDELIRPAKSLAQADADPEEHLMAPFALRAKSALLFGPPGTSKTTLARRLAQEIGWPFLEIGPSQFLRDGLGNIYTLADQIFEDLLELRHAVVFFDEMDALVHSRKSHDDHSGVAELDVTREFLTTSMLPNIGHLHDKGRILFLMATNHQGSFDDAIKRPGRFDILLCVSPPKWSAKLERLEAWTGLDVNIDAPLIRPLQELLAKYAVGGTHAKLDHFTISELEALARHISGGSPKELLTVLQDMKAEKFQKLVDNWEEKFIVLRGKTREEWQNELGASKLQ